MDRAAQAVYLADVNERIDVARFDPPTRVQRGATRWEINLLKRRCPGVFCGGRVLDVGTAEGTFVANLNQAGAKAVGLEPIGRLAEYARSHGLDVRTARFTPDSIPSDLLQEPFDLICFRESGYYLSDLREVFDLLRRILAPGGHIYIKATQGQSIYFRFWPDYLARYNRAVQWIPTPGVLRYIFGQEGYRIRYAGAYPEHTLRILNVPMNRLTRLLSLMVDPVTRPLLHRLSCHDRLVVLASVELVAGRGR